MSSKSWYSAQCIFLHAETPHGPRQLFEERIVLLRAESAEAAIEQAEKEAREYGGETTGCKYLGCANVFEMFADEPGEGVEVFSAMQQSDLTAKEYLDLHYPEVPDDCEAVGETHRWHNLDDKRSACYHCRVIREPALE